MSRFVGCKLLLLLQRFLRLKTFHLSCSFVAHTTSSNLCSFLLRCLLGKFDCFFLQRHNWFNRFRFRCSLGCSLLRLRRCSLLGCLLFRCLGLHFFLWCCLLNFLLGCRCGSSHHALASNHCRCLLQILRLECVK